MTRSADTDAVSGGEGNDTLEHSSANTMTATKWRRGVEDTVGSCRAPIV